MDNQSEILLYQTQDGVTKISVQLKDETVWLTQAQLVELFQKAKSTISEHITNVFAEGELNEKATVRNFRTVQIEGDRSVEREIEYYNLDVIISVGYRVKSQRGTQFRIWATQRLREYIVKGFTMDDERLKDTGYANPYFEELIERIRDIRTSEKNFYYKVREIYSTSYDYNANSTATQDFFATIQNKFHWAIHHHTAAELITARADATKPNMGLQSLKGKSVTKKEITIAKNYLTLDELKQLNLLVEQYLSFAESQALQRKVMYMKDWTKKLHDILTINEREILLDAGKVSHKQAETKAENEYEKYKKLQDKIAIQNLKQLEEGFKKVTSKPKK
jgi:hypothetical protein